MKRIGATLLLVAGLSLVVWQGTAGASAGLNVSWAIRGVYTCNDPFCSTTSASGAAHSDSRALGAMTWTNQGAGSNAVLDCPRNEGGVTVSESWVFTAKNGDTLDLTTTSDNLCFVSAQVATETATFQITGGTGRFSGATGAGTFEITDLTNPSNEMGKFDATINGLT